MVKSNHTINALFLFKVHLKLENLYSLLHLIILKSQVKKKLLKPFYFYFIWTAKKSGNFDRCFINFILKSFLCRVSCYEFNQSIKRSIFFVFVDFAHLINRSFGSVFFVHAVRKRLGYLRVGLLAKLELLVEDLIFFCTRLIYIKNRIMKNKAL